MSPINPGRIFRIRADRAPKSGRIVESGRIPGGIRAESGADWEMSLASNVRAQIRADFRVDSGRNPGGFRGG